MLDEEAFRALLDARGVLLPGALSPPERDLGYAVFAQRPDAWLHGEHLKRQAAQFFGVKLGFTVDKHLEGEAPLVDAARVVISGEGAAGTRLCIGRPATAADVAEAESAERRMGTYGLALLAGRCRMIWLVETESPDDRAALVLAAVLASVLLGPILGPGGDELLGVRSARLKLEGRASPYR
ncbi:MAG: hypothetical protein JWP97_6105 [Labilithrix sp.]|nr:hypothetical protein [Labilithrix sp.]